MSERLSDDETLDWLYRSAADDDRLGKVTLVRPVTLLGLVRELRDRRASDLTAEDVEALRALAFFLHKHSHEPYAYDGEECAAGIAVIDRLLAREGGK